MLDEFAFLGELAKKLVITNPNQLAETAQAG